MKTLHFDRTDAEARYLAAIVITEACIGDSAGEGHFFDETSERYLRYLVFCALSHADKKSDAQT